MPVEDTPATVTPALVNATGSNTIYICVSGQHPNRGNAWMFLRPDGATPYSLHSSQLEHTAFGEDRAIAFDISGVSLRTISVPYIIGDRTWLSIGNKLAFFLDPVDLIHLIFNPGPNQNKNNPLYAVTMQAHCTYQKLRTRTTSLLSEWMVSALFANSDKNSYVCANVDPTPTVDLASDFLYKRGVVGSPRNVPCGHVSVEHRQSALTITNSADFKIKFLKADSYLLTDKSAKSTANIFLLAISRSNSLRTPSPSRLSARVECTTGLTWDPREGLHRPNSGQAGAARCAGQLTNPHPKSSPWCTDHLAARRAQHSSGNTGLHACVISTSPCEVAERT